MKEISVDSEKKMKGLPLAKKIPSHMLFGINSITDNIASMLGQRVLFDESGQMVDARMNLFFDNVKLVNEFIDNGERYDEPLTFYSKSPDATEYYYVNFTHCTSKLRTIHPKHYGDDEFEYPSYYDARNVLPGIQLNADDLAAYARLTKSSTRPRMKLVFDVSCVEYDEQRCGKRRRKSVNIDEFKLVELGNMHINTLSPYGEVVYVYYSQYERSLTIVLRL